MTARPSLTREQVNAKKGLRLSAANRAYMVLELLTTNKTGVQIAAKFGVSPQNVYQLKNRLGLNSRTHRPAILYRRDGRLFHSTEKAEA